MSEHDVMAEARPRRVAAFGVWCASVAACAVAACTPFEVDNVPPVAVAGDDQMLTGASVRATLDGSGSFDDDGRIAGWEWRYTGTPIADEGDTTLEAMFDDDDGGTDLEPEVPDLLKPLPPFCPEEPPDSEVLLPARYCIIDSGDDAEATARVPLEPGRYRFTLWVIDDEGAVADDTLNIAVAP